MTFLLAVSTAALAASGPVLLRTEATVRDPVVRLADVADLSPLPALLRERAAGVVVGRADGRDTVLSARAVSTQARAALPGLSRWLPDVTDFTITVRRPEVEASEPALRVVGDEIAAGQALTLRVEVGPVVVERDVKAVQASRAGRALFVRTPDGAVLTAQVEPRP